MIPHRCGILLLGCISLILAGCGQASLPAPSKVSADIPASLDTSEYPSWDRQLSMDEYAKLVKLSVEKQIIVNDAKFDFVLIPAGEFNMGSALNQSNRLEDETMHHVKISKPFYLSKTEITQMQYENIAGNHNTWFKRPNLPVSVQWNEATRFCTLFAEKTRVRSRLPTEAEWEFACRAGSEASYSFGDNEEGLQDYCWYRFTAENEFHPVGKLRPNKFGLYDMHGNFWEWCSDWYDSNYYSNSPIQNPTGPKIGVEHVYRGGAWNVNNWRCSSSHRGRYIYNPLHDYVGIRLLIEVDGQDPQ